MTTITSPTATADRPHKAAKRYIYAWGDGGAEGNATMRDLLGGKGAGLAEMTKAGLPTPPGFTITTEACNDYFAAGERLPDGLWDDVLEAVREVERADRQGLRRPGQPAPRERPLRRQVLDARDDGHGPQPRASTRRRCRAWSRSPATSASAGTPTAASSRCSAGSSWRSSGERFDHALEAAKERARRQAGHRPRRRRAAATSSASSRRSSRPTPAATSPTTRTSSSTSRSRRSSRSWFGKRARDYRKNQDDPRRPRHGRQRRDDGLRQHGRRLGDRRRLHPRPEHRREGPLRRVPHQRPGRGRRGRHPDRPEDLQMQTDMPEVYARVPAHRPAARVALPRRPGPRVHDRARPPVHAPDTVREADRGRGGADRR